MTDAARILGRPYQVEGRVVRGDRRGRTLGYPTANVAAESMLPADGVYAGIARALDVPDQPGHDPACVGTFLAAVSVGTKPQFAPGQTQRTLEAHLLDPNLDGDAIAGLPEYGWTLRLDLVAWLRGQQRFDSVEALVAQIDRDCQRTREVLAMAGTLPEPVLEGTLLSTEETGCR
jgi:riboflavin kinase/FMN adenylyltransferase